MYLSRLIAAIWHSDRLSHPQRGMWPPELYRELHGEAVQRTLMEICQKIDDYNRDYSVLAWVNYRLKKRFIDVVRDYQKKGITYSPRSQRDLAVSMPSIDDLDAYFAVEDSVSDAQLLQQFIDDDPEHLFRSAHVKNRPEVTFQALAKARLVEQQTWEEIASECQISVQTLCSFFNRRLRKLIPYFQKYLQS